MISLQHLTLLLSAIAVAGSLLAVIQNLALKKKSRQFFAGKQAATLEDFIIALNSRVNSLEEQAENIERAILELRETQKSSIQKIGLTRYNPFADNGGNLSFSIALLDGYNNGVVITSMHGREHNRIYAKPVVNGSSEFTLTKEEDQAIKSSKVIN